MPWCSTPRCANCCRAPASRPTQANIGFYGGLLFAIFLVGWGFAFLWGPIADRFGRVRTLVLTILCYSVFTFLGCVAAGVWQLAAVPLSGGSRASAANGPSAASSSPRSGRNRAASRARRGCTPATTSASFSPRSSTTSIGSRYGWRAVFAVGGAPALLVAFIRYGVSEPKRWQQRLAQLDRRWTARDAFAALFSPEYRRRTIVNAALLFISMVGLWAGSVYVPSSVRFLREGQPAAADGLVRDHAALRRHHPGLPAAAVAGRAIRTARRARRSTSSLMFVCISVGFGYVFYLGDERAARGSWRACSSSGSAAPISRSIRCGCRSSTAPSAAAAPSRSPLPSAASSPRASRSWSARASPACTPSERRSRSRPSRFWPGSRSCRWRKRRAARSCRLTLTHLFDLSLLGRRDSAGAGVRRPRRSPSARSTRAAIAWRSCCSARGLKTGDRLCVYLANCVEMIDLYLACVKLGVIFVPINILYREREIAHILHDAEPAAVPAGRRPTPRGCRRLTRPPPVDRSTAIRPPASSTPPAPPARRKARSSRTTTSPRTPSICSRAGRSPRPTASCSRCRCSTSTGSATACTAG